MAEFSVIGQSVPQIDAKEMLTGTAKYTADFQLPGMLYARILTSPYPHAKIKSIDTSRAEALPGVKAVITYKDGAGLGLWDMDKPVISDTMRFAGDVVAVAAAADRHIAEEALDLIKVEYETLPFVLDAEEAMKPGAPLVHPEITDNNVVTVEPLLNEHGDIKRGFDEADHIIEDRFTVPRVSASAAEPHAAVANWDAEGKLTVWTSTQAVHEDRDLLAKVFGLPLTKVRVIMSYLGGGFGNKYHRQITGLAALLARKAGSPVHLPHLTRGEILLGKQRHSGVITMKLGVKNDGTITAVQTKIILDTGAYVDSGVAVTGVAMGGSSSNRVFRCLNVEAKGYCVYTNTPVAGSYRGFGNPQGHFALELMLAKAAEKIGMDPVEFMLKNLWPSGAEARANGALIVDSFGLGDCIRKGAEAIGWRDKWKDWNTPVAVNGAKRRGIGFATMQHTGGGGWFLGHGSAIIKMSSDGTVQLITGACQAGNSSKTTLSQVCAEALGVRYEDIAITFADTDPCPYTVGSYASRIAHSHSIAIKEAAEKVKEQLFKVAAGKLGVTPEKLEIKDREIYVKEEPAKAVSLKGILGPLFQDVVGSARTHSFMEDAGAFAAQFFDLEVDTETGEVEILKVAAAHDCGTVINLAVCENQVYGGLMQGGIGYGTTEELVLDSATGVTLNPNYLDYKVKTAMDTPDIQPILVQPPDYTLQQAVLEPKAAYGIKGLGEPPLNATAPAILNAIRNAVGINFRDNPVTPDKILKALGKV